MMAIDAASFKENEENGNKSPKNKAPSNVPKIPNWAAAPSKNVFGLAITGEKSVIAPTPIKINNGKSVFVIPMWYKTYNKPGGLTVSPASVNPAKGIFAKLPPKAMGTNNNGSTFFAIPKYSHKRQTQIITNWPACKGKSVSV